MSEQAQSQFNGWAVVEMFGHQKISGFVTTEYFGTACMFRVDVPELPEREFSLTRPGYEGGSEWLPAGTKVKRPLEPGRSKLIGPGAVYAINPCTEEIVRQALENDRRLPLIVLEMPESLRVKAIQSADPDDAEREHGDIFGDEDYPR